MGLTFFSQLFLENNWATKFGSFPQLPRRNLWAKNLKPSDYAFNALKLHNFLEVQNSLKGLSALHNFCNLPGGHSLGPVTTISGVKFFSSFKIRMYLETFLRGGKRIGSGKFFYGQKTDVTSKNPWDPKFDEDSKS